MSSKSVIELKNVSKTFVLNHDNHRSFKTKLINLIRLKFDKKEVLTRKILENVSFSISPGEFVGIMGRNGVGKSTILKMISGIYSVDQGTIETKGRMAPLLELGAGFVADLSGYENIYLNSAILGFSKAEADLKIQEIIDFSELKEMIDAPVRVYSSGMMIRLGFSIAAHLDADILIFDEILAVGDAGFQAKCLKKIDQLKALNKTIILVTHSPIQVQTYCTRCILFDEGQVVFDGPPDLGANKYAELFASESESGIL